MPKGLQRIYGQGHVHFITCSCYRRLPLLGSARVRNIFVKILGEVRGRYGFALVGYVVMPEHIHLLVSEPRIGTPSLVMQVLKQRISRELRRRKHRHGAVAQLRMRFDGAEDRLPQFWQPRFYDFNVWSRKKKIEKLQYMDFNPVKRGLVGHPKDWVWSSFAFYARSGSSLISMDGFLGSQNQNPHR
ncbi:MAG: REP-associated tyrosine transposase [Candidatus Acidiferrales bacterium]